MMEMGIVYQVGLPGVAGDVVAGDVVYRCRVMLQEEPATRRDYWVAYLRYLARYHGFDAVILRARSVADLLRFLVNPEIPKFRTVANRCQELMETHADLKPPADVVAKRQRQRKQGRIR